MTGTPHDDDKDQPEHDPKVETRAELLPEEQVAWSDDPTGQAEAILEDSERRTQDPSGTRRSSSQTLGED